MNDITIKPAIHQDVSVILSLLCELGTAKTRKR